MPARKFLSRDDILRAVKMSKSARACARYLNVDYNTYRMYAKMYKTDDGTKTLFETSLNPSGKGIPKFKKDPQRKQPAIMDIIEGRVPSSVTTPQKLKYRLIEEGYLKEQCNICGYNERRVIDYRMPLLLHHKDGNKHNYRLNNIELLCYNCFFTRIGDVFTIKDELQIESPMQITKTTEAVNWELDDYHIQRLKELGLMNKEEDDSPESLISKI